MPGDGSSQRSVAFERISDEGMSEKPAITARVEELLSRFPGPVTLYPSHEKWTVLAGLSLIFVIVGGLLILNDHITWGRIDVVFFSVCLLLSVMRLLPGAASLTLDTDGFEERALFLRRVQAQWPNVTSIQADAAPSARSGMKRVWYNDTDWSGSWLAGKEAAPPGCNAGLIRTYGLSAEEFADLMAQWQQRTLAAEQDIRERIDLLV
jgi:hypothetical protein